MRILNVFFISIVIFFLSFSFTSFGVFNFLLKNQKRGFIDWENKGTTPLFQKEYTPQGLTWARETLIFANSWDNRNSRVYQIDPEGMEIKYYFDMVTEAVHTSGLAWDGNFLWAVDYKSNRAYCIDMESSFKSKKAEVIDSFDTTLKGTSACCFVNWNNISCLAISDFMRTDTTIFVDIEKAIKTGTAKDAVVFKYKNEGFSQGLVFIDGYLYESENKIGVNIINKMDPHILKRTANAKESTVVQYLAPSKGVEDLAWDGEAIWTSDETVFFFFKGKFQN